MTPIERYTGLEGATYSAHFDKNTKQRYGGGMSDVAINEESTGGITGKGFKPGQSGNPLGRARMPEELKKAFQARSQDALNTLVDVMINGDKNADRIKASDSILDRAWGKPAQTIDGSLNTGVRVIDTAKLPKEQRDALAMLAVSNMGLEGADQGLESDLEDDQP